jgi:hypothetical protein
LVDEIRLVHAVEGLVGKQLAQNLVTEFIKIRQDFATKTLERASPGKFVEVLVQCLQRMDSGSHDAKPNVDGYLATKVEGTALPEGLRICGARIARSIYTLRNKRNIAHKNEVDPNTYDLAFAHQGAAWVMAELVRVAKGISMQEAGILIELLQTPVGTLVEEIDGTRTVHADVSVSDELLILLHSHYPERVPVSQLTRSLARRSVSTVRNRIRDLYAQKLADGDAKLGYRLTRAGHAAAIQVVRSLQP